MNLDSIYKITFLLTLLITVWAAGSVWRRRSAPGARPLFWMMLAIIEWNVCGLMEVFSGGTQAQIFWTKIAFISLWFAQPLFLIFVFDYTRHQKWDTRSNVALMFIMPVITIALALTNEYHHLIWTGFSPTPDGHITYLYGTWFRVSAVYVNLVMLLGTGLLYRYTQHTRELFRHQNIWLMIAALAPWVGFNLYISPFNLFPVLDLTALSFAVTGIVLVFIFSHLSFLDILPIAREFLIDNMLDGLLVLDVSNRVIDINAAAQNILNLRPDRKWIGMRVHNLLPEESGLEELLESAEKVGMEYEVKVPEPRSFEVQMLPLLHDNHQMIGRSIIFQEITNHKNIERALWQVNHELQDKLLLIENLKNDLREMSIRDALTGLYNRRYIEESFAREVAHAKREGAPLSVVLLDLDHFKEINDEFGHSRGDDCLRAMGEAFRLHFRDSDITCRYAGDEFMVMMPDSTAEDAFRRIEVFRQDCADVLKGRPEGLPTVTFSAGIATYPEHADTAQELFCIADKMLYRAKDEGRSCTLLP